MLGISASGAIHALMQSCLSRFAQSDIAPFLLQSKVILSASNQDDPGVHCCVKKCIHEVLASCSRRGSCTRWWVICLGKLLRVPLEATMLMMRIGACLLKGMAAASSLSMRYKERWPCKLHPFSQAEGMPQLFSTCVISCSITP